MFFDPILLGMDNLSLIYTSPDSSDYGHISTEKRFSTIFNTLPIESLSVLDYGCGPGNLCEWFQTKNKLPKEYYGYDIRKETVAIAKEKHPRWSFFCELPTSKNTYDVVLLIGTISYAFDLNIELCKEVYRKETTIALAYLKHDGRAYITVRKNGKERGITNKKLMITYSADEIKEMFPFCKLIDLFEHEWLVELGGHGV